MPNNAVPMTVPMKLFTDDASRSELRSLDRVIFTLAMPVFIGQGITALSAFIGRVIVSKLGTEAFNGINIGMMVFLLIVTIVGAVGIGSATLVAQNFGSGDRKRANQVLQQSIIFGMVISLAFMVIGLSSQNLLFKILGTDALTKEFCGQYLLWLFLGVPFISLGFFLASCLRGAGDTKTPMYASIVMAVLLLILSYGLILGKLGMPRLEATGAALAINISFAAFTAILAYAILSHKTNLEIGLKGWRPDPATFISIFKLGVPSAMEWLLIQLGGLLYIPVINHYGNGALAGYFAGIAFLALAQALTMGFQIASNTLVGQMVGGKKFKEAESVFRRAAFLGGMVLAMFGLLCYVFTNSPLFNILFETLDPNSLNYGREYILILALAMPFMGVSFSIAGGLRGAGNTVMPMVASTIGIYGGRIGLAFAVYYLFHPPLYVIWCSMFPDLAARIIIMAINLKTGRWKTIELVL